MKKDVLFLCQYFYPEYISSATLPRDVALSLKKSGMSVDVLTGFPYEYNDGEKVEKKESYKGINIQRVKYLKLKRSNFIGRLVNFFSFFCSMSFKLLKLRHYKIIIVYSNPPILPLLAIWANKLFKTKIIFVGFDIYPEIAINTRSLKKNSVIDKVMTYINNKLFNSVDRVVALSNDMKDFLINNRNIEEHKIKVIPNWYEIENMETIVYDFPTLDTFIENSDLVVSYFGNMGICQDMQTILDAMLLLKKQPRIKFLLAGHGVKKDEIKIFIEENNLSNAVVFDFLQGQDYKYALSRSDCFVVSLEDSVEGLAVPSKTYSYMMAGKTIVSIMNDETDIAKEVVGNNLGVHVSNGCSKELAEKLMFLANNNDFLLESGKNARERFLSKYTTEKCTKQYLEMIEEML
ncbi:glycosyltransferase family 4 protein [Vagococcus intermedius]|uniref:Glycosyltransferase family 4 protein n=1 Tax=Vagococcus intermedius TaxID=2991418 RepID=A0AAF0CVS7_9ENTE|nr:glycosyltransferase family 4 protein [Vagococcus intermedius]WEG73793.1 glycosyltransferase family 4 protein [Vagococcus intermedius]WEG75878.1 glycosyltransferase family 4 protein [Vagococcus intermedius]